MKKLTTRGFTLIELLVVIAIIGILSAVVLAALSTAREKGDDAGVVSNIDTVATQAAVFVTDNGNSYGSFDDGSGNPTACPTPGTAGTSLFENVTVENAISAAITDSAGGSALCVATPTSYAVAVTRPPGIQADPNKSYFWCADSGGLKCGNDGNAGDNATPIVGGACVPCNGGN